MRLRRALHALLTTGLLTFWAGTAHAADRVGPTALPAWEKWHVSATRDIDAYVARGPVERAPLVLVLQGSPCHPIFRTWDDGGRHRTQIAIPFADAIAERKLPVHFVAFDRRGLTSFDGGNAKNEPRSCTKDRGGVDKAERVADAIAVIRAFRELPWVSEVWVAGHSEGGDVATGVMHAAPELVRAAGVFAGAGPSQFFDDVETARCDGDHAAAEATFLALDAFASGAPPAVYDGHPSERYRTFAFDSSPVDDLRASPASIPVFVAHGTSDRHLPIASADLFVVEASRQRERAVRYLVVEGGGHGFENEEADRQAEVISDFVAWAGHAPHGRSFQTIRLAPPTPKADIVRYFGVRDRVWFTGLPIMGAVAVVACVVRQRRRRQRTDRACRAGGSASAIRQRGRPRPSSPSHASEGGTRIHDGPSAV
ncbi:MAG: prolyl oligopeptidase family serine peptidase [Labilithrix sp.]